MGRIKLFGIKHLMCPPLLQERAFIEQVSPVQYNVKLGFVPHMNVPGTFYVNDALKDLLFEELAQSVTRGEVGGGGGATQQGGAFCVCSAVKHHQLQLQAPQENVCCCWVCQQATQQPTPQQHGDNVESNSVRTTAAHPPTSSTKHPT